MTLVLVTLGSRGDIVPFVSLARALIDDGHSVRLVTQDEFAETAAGSGAEVHGVDLGSAAEVLALPDARRVIRKTHDLRAIRRLMAALAPGFENVYRVTLSAAAGADALLCHPMTFPAIDVAHHLGLPVVQVHHMLAVPTRDVPSLWGHRIAHTLGPAGNRASYALERWLSWQLTSRVMNRLRARVLEQPPLSTREALALRERRVGALVGISPRVLPRPEDWPADVVITGYLIQPGIDPQPLDPETSRFLSAGPPPVFVTLGSTPVPDADRLTRTIVEAAELAGVRVILQAGTAGLGRGTDAERVHVVGTVSYDSLFPLVAAVVHHAGAGTLARVLWHERPSLAVPSFADQYFWAHRVPAIGTGPRPLPLRRLTASRLAGRLLDLATNGSYAARAGEVGAALRLEDGPRTAAETVGRFLSSVRA